MMKTHEMEPETIKDINELHDFIYEGELTAYCVACLVILAIMTLTALIVAFLGA